MSDMIVSDKATMDDPVSSARGGSSSKLFDLRSLVAVVLGLYGLMLLVTGFFDSAATLTKAGGLQVNLYFGIILVLTSMFFVVWRMIAPIRPN